MVQTNPVLIDIPLRQTTQQSDFSRQWHAPSTNHPINEKNTLKNSLKNNDNNHESHEEQ